MKTKKKKFKVVISCDDCNMPGFGCFDGGSETLDPEFDTKEEAEAYGEEYCSHCPPWFFRVVEANPK